MKMQKQKTKWQLSPFFHPSAGFNVFMLDTAQIEPFRNCEYIRKREVCVNHYMPSRIAFTAADKWTSSAIYPCSSLWKFTFIFHPVFFLLSHSSGKNLTIKQYLIKVCLLYWRSGRFSITGNANSSTRAHHWEKWCNLPISCRQVRLRARCVLQPVVQILYTSSAHLWTRTSCAWRWMTTWAVRVLSVRNMCSSNISFIFLWIKLSSIKKNTMKIQN